MSAQKGRLSWNCSSWLKIFMWFGTQDVSCLEDGYRPQVPQFQLQHLSNARGVGAPQISQGVSFAVSGVKLEGLPILNLALGDAVEHLGNLIPECRLQKICSVRINLMLLNESAKRPQPIFQLCQLTIRRMGVSCE